MTSMAVKSEQREHERSECDIEARIELGDRLAIVCRIKDLSPSGFRLQIPEAFHLADEFDLLVPVVPGTDQRCRARLHLASS